MASTRHAPTPEAKATTNGHAPVADLFESDETIPVLNKDKEVDLLLEHPRIQRAMKRAPELTDAQHGFYDILLAEVALLCKWSDPEIVALIREGNTRCGRKAPNVAYCQLMIDEARLKTKTGDIDIAREALLMNLSDAWKIDIKAVIRHGTENALWHLQLENGQEIQLGTSQDLMVQSKVRSKIFDVTGHMIPRYAAKEAHIWDHHIQLVALTALTIDTPEMTRLGQARSYVNGYLESLHCDLDRETSREEVDDLARNHRPFVYQGLLVLFPKNLWLLHVRLLNPQMKQSDLFDLLRLLGGRSGTFTIERPKKTSRSVWRIPPKNLIEPLCDEDSLIPLTHPNLEIAVND